EEDRLRFSATSPEKIWTRQAEADLPQLQHRRASPLGPRFLRIRTRLPIARRRNQWRSRSRALENAAVCLTARDTARGVSQQSRASPSASLLCQTDPE